MRQNEFSERILFPLSRSIIKTKSLIHGLMIIKSISDSLLKAFRVERRSSWPKLEMVLLTLQVSSWPWCDKLNENFFVDDKFLLHRAVLCFVGCGVGDAFIKYFPVYMRIMKNLPKGKRKQLKENFCSTNFIFIRDENFFSNSNKLFSVVETKMC